MAQDALSGKDWLDTLLSMTHAWIRFGFAHYGVSVIEERTKGSILCLKVSADSGTFATSIRLYGFETV